MKYKRFFEKKDEILFVAVDLQERLLPAMNDSERVIKNSNILIEAAKILNIPLIITEQYPRGLGKTDSRIQNIDSAVAVCEKVEFSIFQSESFLAELKKYPERNTIILFGVETHVCMYQSALDARYPQDKNDKYYVYLAADACSSRTKENHEAALKRMEQRKISIETTEMIVFQLLGSAKADGFKQISSLVK